MIKSEHVIFLWPCANSQNSGSCCHSSALSVVRALIQYKGRIVTIIFNSICRKSCSLRMKLLTHTDNFVKRYFSDHSVIPTKATETGIKGLSIFEA